MHLARKNGATSNIFRALLRRADTGQGLTALTISSAGLIISTICDNEATATTYTQAGSTIETITTLGTFATPTATKCRFKEVDATNHPGLYEVQLADARYAVSSAKILHITISGVTNLLAKDVTIQLTSMDVDDGVRAGLSAMPNVASGSAGALLVDGTGTAAISNSAGKVLLQATQSGVTIPTVIAVTNQLTAAQIATGVWQDTTAGDFTTAGSIGKSLFTSGVVPGGNGGIMISGANTGPWTVSGGTTLSGGVIFQNSGGIGFLAQCTSGNFAGAKYLGSGTGDGFDCWSGTGATGKGIYALSQASNDYGAYCISSGTAATCGIFGSLNGTVLSVTGAVGSVTGAVGSVTAPVNLPTIPNNWIVAAGIQAGALNGKGDWNTTTPPTTAQIATALFQDLLSSSDFGTAGSIGALLKTLNAIESDVGATSYTIQGVLRLLLAASFNQNTGANPGNSSTIHLKSLDGTKDRAVIVVDANGNAGLPGSINVS